MCWSAVVALADGFQLYARFMVSCSRYRETGGGDKARKEEHALLKVKVITRGKRSRWLV